MKYLMILLFFFVEISIQARSITDTETISVNETIEDIVFDKQKVLTINSGVILTVTGSITLGEQANILGNGILKLGGSGSQTITLTSIGWNSESVINVLKIGNYSVSIIKSTGRTLKIANIDYNCIPSAIDLSALNNTPLGTNVAPNVPGAISSDSPKCIGTPITFTKGTCTTGTCYWVSSETGTEITNSTNTYITASTVGTYTVYVRANSGACWSAASTSSGSVLSLTTSAINVSTQTNCANIPATLAGNNPTIGIGNWTVTGPSSSLLQFANPNLYNTTFTPNGGAGNYDVTWTISNGGCTSSATATITALAVPTAAGSVSGSKSKCTGSTSELLTLIGNSNSIEKWQSSTVYDFSSNVTDIANLSSTYTSGALSANTYFRAVTSNSTCTEYSQPATIMVKASVPSAAGVISGTTIQCAGLTGQVYSISDVNNASTYNWVVPTGWTITAGQATTSITVNVGSAGQNGSITVTPSNACGASAASNLAVSVVSSVPATPGTISGSTPICHNLTGQVYSISPIANASSYLWTVPTGWSITSGAGSTTLTVTSGTSSTSGNISVSAINACGLSPAKTLAVTVSAGSTAPTAITGNPSVCLGTGITLTATGGTAYTGCIYQWGTGTVGSNIISGVTTSSYTVTPTVGNSTITYWTRRMDASPCNVVPTDGVTKSIYVSVMPTFTVTAIPNPAYTKSSLSITGAPSGMAYVWSGPSGFSSTFQNPTFIPTVTSQSGIYTVKATNSYGCTATAITPYVTVTDVSVHTTQNDLGNLNAIATWDNSPSTTFNLDAQTYVIAHTCSLNTDWTVSGLGTKILVKSGVTFTIPYNKTLTTTSPVTIDLENGATLIIANAVIPNLGVLGLTSTVNFSGSNVNQIIPANYYGNLTVGLHGSDTVTFQPGYTGIYGTFSHVSTNTYETTGNTIVFNGVNQNIPVFPYNNLSTEYGGIKILTGDIRIKNHLRVGAVTKLSCGANSIYLEGTGELVSLAGIFDPGSGTVFYTNTGNATVKAMNYWNLNTVNGPRTLEPDSVISIANVFTPGTSNFTTIGSTVEFVAGGSILQTIPVLNPAYNNVKIFANTTTALNLGGDVTIAGSLYMIKGKLSTLLPTPHKLTISNPSASAVSDGSSNSYIIGPLTRILNANSTPTNETFVFPVGDATYLPFSFSNYTTSTTQNITVRAISTNCAGTYNATLKNISTTEYWSAGSNSLTDNFECKVSLARNSSLGSLNAIGHCHASAVGVFISVNGSLSGNSVKGSKVTNFSYFVLAENVATVKTYYSKPGATNLSNLSDWTTNTSGTGTTPVTDGINFASDNVTWVIQTNSTLINSLNITGSNANIQIQANVIVPSGVSMYANNITQNGGTLTVNNGATITATGDFTFNGNSQTLSNSGTINIIGNLTLTNGSNTLKTTINNYGTINLDGDFSMSVDNKFDNQGTFNITTGSFLVENASSNPTLMFTNNINGKVLINNTNSSTSTVKIPSDNNMSLIASSSFNVIGSDVLLTSNLKLTIGGLLSVQNGNFKFAQGGAGFTVPTTGSLYLFDTNGDPSNPTGILNESNGAQTIVVDGKMYVEGVTAQSGSNAVTASTTGLISVGNIGLVEAGTSTSSNKFIVNGGTLNFCGNLSVSSDYLGEVKNNGTINYTTSDYVAGVNPGSTTPGQSDFTTDPAVTQIPAYATKQACMDQFMADVVAAVPYVVTSSNALPISLEYFDVKLRGDKVAIEWRTATETNNDFFTVMKSYDASTFEILGTVNGAGTSTIKHNYKFYDEDPQNGLNYYKVKQTDFDGVSTFTPTKSIKFKKKNVYMQVYPVPGKVENITIKLWSEKSETVTVLISDLLGRVYTSGQIEISTDRLELPLSNFAEFVSGKYIVSVVSNLFVENIEIIVE